jgi:predicted SprT family Zn-dependent metalloprotease
MWKIDYNIRDYLGDSRVEGYSTSATCDSSWQYFTATIDFSYIQLKDMEEKEIEKIIIHELLHIVVNEMREDGIEHEERVVSHLQMIVSYLSRKE